MMHIIKHAIKINLHQFIPDKMKGCLYYGQWIYWSTNVATIKQNKIETRTYGLQHTTPYLY